MKSRTPVLMAICGGMLVMLVSVLSLAEVNTPKAAASSFQLSSSAVVNNGQYPYQYSYCRPDAEGKRQAAKDLSPPLRWTAAPAATQSFALIVSDLDVPVNVPANKPIAVNQARQTAYHWVLVNIPVSITRLPQAAGSKGFVPGGKQPGATAYGDAGINLYNDVLNSPDVTPLQFIKNKVYAGIYGQYDGPCPPWDDLKTHRYVITVYALDIKKLNVPDHGMFTGTEALKAMRGHILAKSSLTAYYVTPASSAGTAP